MGGHSREHSRGLGGSSSTGFRYTEGTAEGTTTTTSDVSKGIDGVLRPNFDTNFGQDELRLGEECRCLEDEVDCVHSTDEGRMESVSLNLSNTDQLVGTK